MIEVRIEDGSYLFTTPYASGLIVVMDGEITETAPIYYKLRGQSSKQLVIPQRQRNGFKLEKLDLKGMRGMNE